MTARREAENLFEQFCEIHDLTCTRVPTSTTPTPDYQVSFNSQTVYVEVKQIDADADFNIDRGGSRTVGAHIRQKILESRPQAKVGAQLGVPSILLVYNNLDPMQLFGTEQHDFLAAMYGEMTVSIRDRRIVDSYYGRNALLRRNHNTSFSAVGHLLNSAADPSIRLYANAHARHSLDPALVPSCFEFLYVDVT